MGGTRIAMWSGPRNISTAMMRSWGSREDTYVTDEPFYANYLRNEDAGHPGREEVLEAYPEPWEKVAEWLTGPIPQGKSIWYQKQMSHHLLPGMEGIWLDGLTHAFLIRDPALVVASFSKVVENPELSDLGFEQQSAIFERVRGRTGCVPPVVDSDDILRAPRAMLARLCEALGVSFDEAMLSWKPGPRDTDGVWARHWYGNVEKSSGFQPWKPREVRLEGRGRELEEECRPYYERLAKHKLSL
ncbi:MAG: HAD family hydrolase [Thermoanaerobaculia bacterium]|nr:HAD family hydrolase [Thermoanaerobaculia bacterium]